MDFAAALKRFDAYERLIRLDKPIGALLLLWPTLWAVWIAGHGRPLFEMVLIFVVGTILMRSAGCALNDWADRDFDGKVARTRDRPLAAGEIAPNEALVLGAMFAVCAFGLVLFLNRFAILLSVAALAIACLYPFAKRVFPLPQIFLGIAFSFGVPMAFAASINVLPWECWVLFAAGVCYGFAYDTEYAMVDRDDDLKIGIHSSAITLGRYDVAAVMASYAADGGAARLAGCRHAVALAVLHRPCDRCGDDDLPLHADPRPLARRLLSRFPPQQLGRPVDLRGHRRFVLPVSQGDLLTEFDFGSGGRLALYTNRVVLHGADAMESVPLAHLASVRVAFERDPRKLNWAVGLLVFALLLAMASGPLQGLATALAAGIKEQAGRESFDAVLQSSAAALHAFARLLSPLAVVLTVLAAALLVFFWLGLTTLTLSFAATERAFPARGRNQLLFQFADAVAEQLDAPRGKNGA